MTTSVSRRAFLCAAVAGAVCFASPALAEGQSPFMPSYGKIHASVGWYRLLDRAPYLRLQELDVVPFNGDTLYQLHSVFGDVSKSVRYVSDGPTDIWRIADSAGDCEDIALRSMVELRKRGFPRGALRIAACYWGNQPHAVLTIETTKGTYVIDYLLGYVGIWHGLPFQWHSRESVGLDWDDLSPPRDLEMLLSLV